MNRSTNLCVLICLASTPFLRADDGELPNSGRMIFDPQDFSLDLQIVNELAIREPSMCNGAAQASLRWNRNQNWVKLKARFDGLPHRPSYHFADYLGNPGHDLNPMPDEVENGVWQMWLIGRWATVSSTWYFDSNSGEILGNEWEFGPDGRFGPDGPPADAIPVEAPAFQLICTPSFESDPVSLKAEVEFTFQYDALLDDRGTGGTYSTILPTNLFDESTLDLVAVVGGLPVEQAMSFDDILTDLTTNTGAVALYTSLEPQTKPDYLLSRDNAMIGWASVLPRSFIVPIVPPSPCGTYQLDHYFDFIPQ